MVDAIYWRAFRGWMHQSSFCRFRVWSDSSVGSFWSPGRFLTSMISSSGLSSWSPKTTTSESSSCSTPFFFPYSSMGSGSSWGTNFSFPVTLLSSFISAWTIQTVHTFLEVSSLVRMRSISQDSQIWRRVLERRTSLGSSLLQISLEPWLIENSYREGLCSWMYSTRSRRVNLLKLHSKVTGMALGLQTVQVGRGFSSFNVMTLLIWFCMKQLFIFCCCPRRYFSISMISIPLTMELVLAIAGTMFPAMFLTSLKDCCWMPKQNMRKLAALVMKWMMSSSSFSKTTAPCYRFTTDSLWKDSTKALMEVSRGCTLSCRRYPPNSRIPMFWTSNSSGTVLMFLAKIWLSLLSVSDFAFRMFSMST